MPATLAAFERSSASLVFEMDGMTTAAARTMITSVTITSMRVKPRSAAAGRVGSWSIAGLEPGRAAYCCAVRCSGALVMSSPPPCTPSGPYDMMSNPPWFSWPG